MGGLGWCKKSKYLNQKSILFFSLIMLVFELNNNIPLTGYDTIIHCNLILHSVLKVIVCGILGLGSD